MWPTESLVSHININEFRTDKVCGDGYHEPEGCAMTIVFKLQNVFAADGLHLLYTVALLLVVYTVL
jgi:hypothetical protein